MAFQWGWQFSYPSRPGVVDRSAPGRPATLHVPAGTTVEVSLRTRDVVHAFWIPDLRFKRDAWPRKTARFDLRFPAGTAAGVGHCAQFCGLKHSDMVFFVDAMDAAALRELVAGQGRARVSATITPPFAPVRGLVGLAVGTDHKGVALRLGTAAFGFFLAGGVLALLMRAELAQPGMQVTSRGGYDQLFSMHGSTMIYLFVTPARARAGDVPRAAADRAPRRSPGRG